jgi:chitinase
MKTIFLLLIFLTGLYLQAQVAINPGGTPPDPSAMLDVQSTTKGFLPPRMTNVQLQAIPSPPDGLIVFCTNCGSSGNGAFMGFYNGTWNQFTLTPTTPVTGSSHDLSGYWHNWSDASAPYIQLPQVDSRYSVVNVAFAVPHAGTDYQMEFIPDQVSVSTFVSQIQTLKSQGKKVVISVGGANDPISLDNTNERNIFISTMNNILTTFGFDGMDIDFEGSSLTISGGTIANPTDPKVINLIYALRQIMIDFRTAKGSKMFLSFAPETAFVQGGMAAFGGIWGAYLPVLHALRDSLEIVHVQLYNSGSMPGINGNYYSQGTADFIVAMTEAIIQGFNTGGGFFTGIPAEKVAVGLPACPNAAGGGFTDTTTVKAAIDYLRGAGPKPGSYTLAQAGGYPPLRGMMTWSVNWDAVSTCGSAYQYAKNYIRIFGNGK